MNGDDLNLIGKTIGNFRVDGLLGQGGMGVVYKAHDKVLTRNVAIKVLSRTLQDEEFVKRFIREARLTAKLEHPNIVQVHTVNKFGNLWYLAMQYVKGKTLEDYINEGYRFSIKDCLVIIRSVADVLNTTHRYGVIHRDLKPSNIMIDEEGRVKVMDFGLARSRISPKITQEGTYLGTPQYSSPEQCISSAIDERSDIYSLGVVLYELLSGKPPYQAETSLSLMKKITEEEPTPLRSLSPEIPISVADLTAKMMAKDKEARSQSAKDIIDEIDRIIKEEPLPALSGLKLAEPTLPQSTRVTPVKMVTPATDYTDNKRISLRLALTLGGIAVILLIVVVGLLTTKYYYIPQTGRPADTFATLSASRQADRPELASIPATKNTVVVFDFKDMTNFAPAQWLEPAISDWLITNLNQSKTIQAIPRYDLLEKMRQANTGKVNLLSSPEERIILTPESKNIINSFNADVVIGGVFYIINNSQIRIIANAYRYIEGDLQHIASCQASSENYTADILKLIDTVSVKLAETINEKASLYQLAQTNETPFTKPPDITQILLVELNRAKLLQDYLGKLGDEKVLKQDAVEKQKGTLSEELEMPSFPVRSAADKGLRRTKDDEELDEKDGALKVEKTAEKQQKVITATVPTKATLVDDLKKIYEHLQKVEVKVIFKPPVGPPPAEKEEKKKE
ncbi:MAG: serine/threonine-protein kinase [Planctomycetota bacterium]|nr:serine/threonine-protein kinase [Planctomycetota bacterium]